MPNSTFLIEILHKKITVVVHDLHPSVFMLCKAAGVWLY